PHISMITLGVADIGEATAFYERLGFTRSSESQDAVTFMQAGAVVLGLFGRDALKDDAKADSIWTGNGGTAVAMNRAGEAEVDAMMEVAKAAGARILKPAEKVFWGGYSGYFADPDDHAWEVAYNPFWSLDESGRVDLP
ncbi:MAG TPA: glyoxalase, partial [Methyloceanibacter sp.]|nr:glyoxalase [Methyloceanibacter sp.]